MLLEGLLGKLVTYSKIVLYSTGGEGAKKRSEDKSIGKPEHRK
jgi:hypothetical protein